MASKKKKRLLRLGIFLAVDIIVILIIYGMLTAEPSDFAPPKPIRTDEVSPYITHEIGEDFFNGVSRKKPFELEITQDGLNDILARQDWPIQMDSATLESASIQLLPGKARLMGKVKSDMMTTVLTADITAKLDLDGNMNLEIGTVKAGNLPIRMIFMPMMKKSASANYNSYPADSLERMLADSLSKGEAFEPIFDVSEEKIKIQDITFEDGLLRLKIEPIS